jgi:MFS family permease
VSGSRHPNAILSALLLATATYGIAQTLLLPSLPAIQRHLHTSAVGVTLLISVFFVTGASTAGVFGRLGDMFGKRRVLLAQMTLFSLGALVCGLGSSLPLLIAGRGIMGASVGLFPLSYSLLRDEMPARRVPTTIAFVGGVAAISAAVGQATGGVVTDRLGYHWIFWIGLIGGVASIAAIALLVPESRETSPGRVDVGGAVLLAIGLGVPLTAISLTPAWGWVDARTLGLIAIGLATVVVFVRYEQRHPQPLLHLSTLMVPRVRLTNLTTFLVGFGLFGASAIISQFVQQPKGVGLGVSATQSGFFLAPGLALMLVLAPIGGRISRRYDPKATLVMGAFIGCSGIGGLALHHGSNAELYLWPTIMYIGVGFSFGALPLLILESVPRAQSGQSTSVNMIFRNAGSSIGVQLAATFIAISGHDGGHPTERGFTHAFTLEASAALGALLLALAIPGRKRGRQVPSTEAVDEAVLKSESM